MREKFGICEDVTLLFKKTLWNQLYSLIGLLNGQGMMESKGVEREELNLLQLLFQSGADTEGPFNNELKKASKIQDIFPMLQ